MPAPLLLEAPHKTSAPSFPRSLARTILAASFALIALTACSTFGPHQPFTYRKTWSANDPAKLLTYRYLPLKAGEAPTQPYFKDAYALAVKSGGGATVRNTIIFELMGIVDDYYFKHTVELRAEVSGKNLLVDLSGIATSFAASLVGGEQAKTVLAAISTGLQTFSTGIDKEVFMNTSVQAIRFQMDANRASVATDIFKKMPAPAADYPLEAGLRDIIAYYDAGTVTSGLTSLAAEAAKKKDSSETAATAAQAQITHVGTYHELIDEGVNVSDLLEEYWMPGGVEDPAHRKTLVDWIAAHGLQDVTNPAEFISDGTYAKKQAACARALGLL